MITQEKLKDAFDYDPEAGLLVWKNPSKYCMRMVGKEAGTLDNTGYVHVKLDGKVYLAHRLMWLYTYGEWPVGCIDHIDGDKTNNRMCNLRDVTQSVNCRNTKLNKNSSTGVTGVSKTSQGYLAYISRHGEDDYLGRFKDFFEACCARKSAELKHGYLGVNV